jgi:hypothetical protein
VRVADEGATRTIATSDVESFVPVASSEEQATTIAAAVSPITRPLKEGITRIRFLPILIGYR